MGLSPAYGLGWLVARRRYAGRELTFPDRLTGELPRVLDGSGAGGARMRAEGVL